MNNAIITIAIIGMPLWRLDIIGGGVLPAVTVVV